MQLSCSFCKHSFQSAFGPPNVHCPSCGSKQVVHADEMGGHHTPPPFASNGPAPYRFQSTQSAFGPPPNSVPSHLLNTLPWLAASVVLAIFCQPIGLAGLYFSDQAKTLARWGRMEEARAKLGYAQACVLGGFALVAIAVFVGIVMVILEKA